MSHEPSIVGAVGKIRPSIPSEPSDPIRPKERPSRLLRKAAVRFLNAGTPEERAAWLDVWERDPDREVMAHPDYVRLFLRPGDQAIGAVLEGEGSGIIYPVIERPLRTEPWAAPDEEARDLTTAYGYGGPFAWGIPSVDRDGFWTQFRTWARRERIVFAFARLGLDPECQIEFDGEVRVNAPNIVRRLEISDTELWGDYQHRVRQNVNLARRCGLRFLVDRTGERLDDFLRVYTSTMNRRGALHQYYFPRSFFESIIRDLAGSMVFLHVLNGERIVSSELVLLSRRHAYSYLGGSLPEGFDVRANHFLKHEAFLWLRDAGWKAMLLGGGYRGSNGVLEYKRSLAPRGEVPFRIGTQVYDPASVDRLVDTRRRWENDHGRDWTPDPSFFPTYRS